KNHMKYWMDGRDELAALPDDGKAHAHRALVRMPDGTFLNRYWDDAKGPRIESYKADVDVARRATKALMDAVQGKPLGAGAVAWLNNKIETTQAKIYKDLRAGAASGWDYSSRWFKEREAGDIGEEDSELVRINT